VRLLALAYFEHSLDWLGRARAKPAGPAKATAGTNARTAESVIRTPPPGNYYGIDRAIFAIDLRSPRPPSRRLPFWKVWSLSLC